MEAMVMVQPQFVARIRTERAAGQYLWDVAYVGSASSFALAKEGVLDPVLTEMIDPDVNRPELWGGWENAFVDEQQKFIFATSHYIAGPSYNARHLAPEKVERLGIKVLLEPELKGRIAWHDPTVPGPGRTQSYLIRKELGDDGLRKLVLEQNVLFVGQMNQVVDAIARDVAWVGLGPPVKMMMEPYVKAGVRADIRMFGRTPDRATANYGGETLQVFNKRPHPAAARLFVNWILSKGVQERMSEALGQGSRRVDVRPVDPDTTPLPGVTYDASQRESYEPQVQAASDTIKRLRAEAR
jgi:ABC-type Fe3+ transport system substrate-binding protein